MITLKLTQVFLLQSWFKPSIYSKLKTKALLKLTKLLNIAQKWFSFLNKKATEYGNNTCKGKNVFLKLENLVTLLKYKNKKLNKNL